MENKVNKTRVGTIVSDKMDKTVVIKVDRTVAHRLYLKKYAVSNKFKAHDQENQFKTGDVVEFVEIAPMSKDKKFKVTRKVK